MSHFASKRKERLDEIANYVEQHSPSLDDLLTHFKVKYGLTTEKVKEHIDTLVDSGAVEIYKDKVRYKKPITELDTLGHLDQKTNEEIVVHLLPIVKELDNKMTLVGNRLSELENRMKRLEDVLQGIRNLLAVK